MHETRLLIRWSIPGSLVIGFFAGFLALRMLFFQGHTLSTLLTNTAFGQLSFSKIIAAAALALAIGYVIYQIYFRYYWSCLPARIGPLDRGTASLKGRKIVEHIGEKDYALDYQLDDDNFKQLTQRLKSECGRGFCKLPEPEEWPSLPRWLDKPWFRFFMFPRIRLMPKGSDGDPPTPIRYQNNLYLSIFALSQALQNMTNRDYIRNRIDSTTDIFHSIGVARLALWIAVVLFLFNEIGLHYVRTGEEVYLWGLAPAMIITLLGSKLLTTVREQTLNELLFLLHDTIYHYYYSTPSVNPQVRNPQSKES